MTPEQQKALAIARARRRRSEAQGQKEEPGYGSQIFSGLLEGATGALGAPVDLMNNLVVSPALKGVNAVFGTDFEPSAEPLGGAAGLRKGLAISPESDQRGHQMARRVSQSVGGAAVPLSVTSRSAGELLAGLGAATGGGVGGATAQQLYPDNVGAEMAGELLGGLATGGAISGIASRSARKAAEKAVPEIEDLKLQASDLYKAAEARGVVARANQTKALSDDIAKIARDNELITPTGRVSTAYPKAKEALDLMQDYGGFDMNPTQMQVIRETLADAARTTEGKESRIATKMLKTFDDFTTPLAPELQEARDIASRYLKAQKLETVRELAGSRAGQFTGSGFENALRTEYRGLERKLIKGQEKGWTPQEQEAIKKVAQGTAASNTFRNLGRMAPTGPVSFSASAGVPFAIGTALTGNPWVGSAMGAATSALGYGARGMATKLGMRNADLAEMLVRSGGNMPSPISTDQLRRRLIEALIGGNAAASSN
ncbi:hypothetical protein [Shinella sp.]|uniref:hypothetical protein n=1 Tax=Shinella sp. TaxID=1870904 RepID=UPI003D26733D